MKHDQGIQNKIKYKKPPTIEQINTHVKHMDMTTPHFERYFGIPYGTIGKIRCGERELPVKFWNIIYKKMENKPRGSYKRKKANKTIPNISPIPPSKQTQSGVLNKLKESLD